MTSRLTRLAFGLGYFDVFRHKGVGYDLYVRIIRCAEDCEITNRWNLRRKYGDAGIL